ncbi:hypothetical protein [uncultured Chitinophaga sp.]|uniref:hypothetical protein n=1 Tax=uncultured Chitinophaga sp. TaxID=339340 RepID=UPI0025F19187|nr:hypothetical protein [uncultured Chitinophaga sp.]
MKSIYALAVAAALVFTACSKKDDAKPDTGAKTLSTKVLGKWSLGSEVEIGARKAGSTLAKETSVGEGFVEFLADSTYYIHDARGKFYTGKYSALDSINISLGSFGKITAISFTSTGINFKLTYGANNEELTLAGVKIQTAAADDKTKLISRIWSLTKEDNGESMFGQWPVWDAAGEIVGYKQIDSITIQFSTYGTRILRRFENTVLIDTDVTNWKWHATEANRFLFYPVGTNPGEYPYETALELTKDIMKTEQVADFNGDGLLTADEKYKYTLKPAVK